MSFDPVVQKFINAKRRITILIKMDYKTAFYAKSRALSYAWSQVYQRDDQIIELQRRELRRPTTIEVIQNVIIPYRQPDGINEPAVLPPHITRSMFEMARQLNKDYTCSCCLEFMTADTFSMTRCGHEVCTKCFEFIRENTPIIQRPKCPICRKDL